MKKLNSAELRAHRLSPNFVLSEFCEHSAALEHDIYNVPDDEGIARLQMVCNEVLQPIRDFYASPVVILRGFVSQDLCKYLALPEQTVHRSCCAVDFRVQGKDSMKVVDWLTKNLPYDIVLLENFSCPWIHLEYQKENNRFLNLTVEDGRRKLRLSKNFTLWELTNSATARARRLYNVPDEAGIFRLRAVCENILQPVRDHFGLPVDVSSGYRSPSLNKVIKGSSPTSQHMRCEAADFEINGIDNYELADWIRVNLDFDQLILEHHHPEKGPNDGWVHASYTTMRPNRQKCLRIGSDGTFKGLGQDCQKT